MLVMRQIAGNYMYDHACFTVAFLLLSLKPEEKH